MTILSTLCRASRIPSVINRTSICKIILTKEQNAFKQALRHMSDDDDRTFYVTPSRFQYTKFKDDLHFYIALGVIPLAIVIIYCNIFIGPATLSEIPEGYVPHPHEYHRHPIKRFFAKYTLDDPQVLHEKMLQSLSDEKEKIDWSDTIRKAQKLMRERDDYKAWYFLPFDYGRQYRYVRKQADEFYELRGYR